MSTTKPVPARVGRGRIAAAIAGLIAALGAAPALVPGVARAATEPCRDFPSVQSSAVAGQPVQYTVTASAAFVRLDVKLRWSDGPDDALVSLQTGATHTFTHTFASAGSYAVFVTAQGPLAAGGFCSAFEHAIGTVSVAAGGSAPPAPPAPPGNASPDLQDLLQGGGCEPPLATPIGAPARIGWIALPGSAPDDGFCPQRLRARTWNRPGRIPTLQPGDAATVASPELSPTQRTATVTLGTSAGDVVVTLSEEDARLRRFSRTACLLVAGTLARRDLVRSGILAPNAKALIDAGDFLALSAVGKYLVACLTLVDDALAGSARPVALSVGSAPGTAARAAAAAGCPVRRVPVRLSAQQATSTLQIRAQRAGAPPPTLRVTCRMTPAGLQLRVSPRRAGVSLRSVVGSRLKVGLLRVPRSRRTLGPTIAFRR